MINTVFHFVNDPTFDYNTAVTNGDISEYTIVFNAADRSIRCKNSMYGRMSRADMATVLGDMSDILPVATSDSLGAIKIGFTSNTSSTDRKYAVLLDENNRAYVSVPWTDTVTPVFDDSELKSLVATERGRIDAFIANLGDTIDQKNRELYADSQWVNDVFGNGLEPGTVAWAFRNQVDGYLNSYSVWEYIDPEHPELGRKARISEIQQDLNGITTRVGAAELNIDTNTGNITSVTTRTSTLEQRADSITARVGAVETKADATDVALSSFQLSVNTEIGGIKTAHTNLSSSVATYETTNDGNIGNLIKMASAVLDLKASSDAQGNLSTTTDLANVITNGSFTGYSGLSLRVTSAEGSISANASLIASVKGTVDNLDVDGKITTATAGLASETWVGQNYDTKGSASSAESSAKGYADNIVAGAKASLIASVDEVCAGIGVTVTKDANGNYTSVTQIDADNINLNGQTNFKTAVGGFIKTDVLEAGTATIDAATIKGTLNGCDGTFTGALSAATGTFSGELTAASGSFSGDIYANLFRAGNENGFNITVSPDSIDFNYGTNRQAWFTTKKLVMDTNGTIVDANEDASQGFYLYLISPKSGNVVTIDFDNLAFKEVVNSSVLIPTHNTSVTTITAGTGGAASIGSRTIYYQNVDQQGTSIPNKYYWNSECTNAISGDLGNNCYVKVKSGYCVVSEDIMSGSIAIGNRALRLIDVYQPATYVSQAGRIVGSGSKVYVITKGSSYYFANVTATTDSTLYNTGVYLNADPNSPLSNLQVAMRLSSDNSAVSTYITTYSSASSIPTASGTVSIFTPGNNNSSMSKVNYS